MGEIITVRLGRKEIRLLNELVKMGYFNNRSEAVRIVLKKALQEFVVDELKSKIVKKLGSPIQLTEEQLLKYGDTLFGNSVAEKVTEGRER